MCLILFASKVHPRYSLVLAANRDESYARPTAPAAFWKDDARIYGGRDLAQGGTWLGINLDGAFAAVTNYRSAGAGKTSSRSRGDLVANFLRGRQSPRDYLAHVRREADEYNGFNLLAGDLSELRWMSNRSDADTNVSAGVHGLSNHLLNTAWPKVERGKQRLRELLDHEEKPLIDGLFEMLAERTIAGDDALPQTGVGLARERVLSPAFIVSPSYGTRCSTVVLVDYNGTVTFAERSFGEGGVFLGATSASFALQPTITAASA